MLCQYVLKLVLRLSVRVCPSFLVHFVQIFNTLIIFGQFNDCHGHSVGFAVPIGTTVGPTYGLVALVLCALPCCTKVGSAID